MNPNTYIPNFNFSVTLDGKDMDTHLVSLSVLHAINRIPKATLEFNYRDLDQPGIQTELDLIQASTFDPVVSKENAQLSAGKELVICLGENQNPEEIFRGYITSQRLKAGSEGTLVLTVDCKHAANKLTLFKRTRMHHSYVKQNSGDSIQKISDQDAIKRLLSDNYPELKAIFPPLETAFQHENLTQYDCSDWDFVIMRSEAMGLLTLVEKDKLRFIHAKPSGTKSEKLVLGENILEFESETDESKVASEIGFGSWESDKQATSKPQTQLNPDKIETIQSGQEFSHTGSLSLNEMRAWTENQKNRQQLGKTLSTVRMNGNNTISLGQMVTVCACDVVVTQRIIVSAVKHTLQSGKWNTSLQLGLSARSHAEEFGLVKSPDVVMLPEAGGMLYGKVLGYKTGQNGHELIEVELPVSKEQSKPTVVYARLATMSAGTHGGTVFRPYPNDEVIVGFIQNDPRFPVILGSLHNGKNPAPFHLKNGEQKQTGLKTGDWSVIIDEEEQCLKVASAQGRQLTIDEKNKKVVLEYDSTNQITVDANGITLKGKNITLEATQKMELSGMQVRTKASTDTEISAGTQLSLEGKVTTTIKGQLTQIN